MNAESNEMLPVSEKYMLTIKEAAAYFNIGIKKMRRIAEDNLGTETIFRLRQIKQQTYWEQKK